MHPDVEEIKSTLKSQGASIEDFKKGHMRRVEQLEENVREIAARSNRPLKPDTKNGLTSDPEYKNAFDAFLRKGQDDGLLDIQQKSMNSGSDPDGGYLVIPEMDESIDRVADTVSAIHRLADVRTISSNKYEKLVKTSGMAMRRVADGETGGETDEPRYAKISIEVHTAEAEPWVNNETLDDAMVDLAMDLADEAGIAFGEGGGAEFVTGDGVGGARGFLTYDTVANANFEWGKLGYIPTGASGAFPGSDPADVLIDLQHSLKQQYRQGAVWLMNDATLGIVRQFKDSSGSYYLWQPDPSAGFGGRLLGHPVEIDDNMPDIGAGSFAVAFGNFKRGYKVINRKGTTLIRDPFTSKGKTKFNFRKRFGGGVFNFEAIKLLKFATS